MKIIGLFLTLCFFSTNSYSSQEAACSLNEIQSPPQETMQTVLTDLSNQLKKLELEAYEVNTPKELFLAKSDSKNVEKKINRKWELSYARKAGDDQYHLIFDLEKKTYDYSKTPMNIKVSSHQCLIIAEKIKLSPSNICDSRNFIWTISSSENCTDTIRKHIK